MDKLDTVESQLAFNVAPLNAEHQYIPLNTFLRVLKRREAKAGVEAEDKGWGGRDRVRG